MARRRFGFLYERTLPSGKKTWVAEWSEPGRGRPSRSFGSGREAKREASKFLDEVEQRLRLGTYTTPPKVAEVERKPLPEVAAVPTFVEYAEKLIENRLSKSKAEATVTLYRANLKALRAYFGRREVGGRIAPAVLIDAITTAAMLDYQAWRRTWRGDGDKLDDGSVRPVGPAVVNRDTAFASVVLSHAVTDGLLRVNPLRGFKKLDEPRKPRRVLSRGECAKLIMAAPGHFRPYVVAALHTGARPCELKSICWRDVDFERRKLALTRTKVGNADWIDLHPTLAEELKRVSDARGDVKPGDHVLLDAHGKPYGRDVRKDWDWTVAKAGLTDRGVTPYITRHTFAVHFLDHGKEIDLQSQLGHTRIETTMIYGKMKDERRRTAVMALDYGTAKQPTSTTQPGAVSDSVATGA